MLEIVITKRDSYGEEMVVTEVVVVAELEVLAKVVVVAGLVLVMVKVKTKAMHPPQVSLHWILDCNPPVPLCIQDCKRQWHTKSSF